MNYFMQLSAYGELVWTATWQAALLAAVVFAITATMSRFISASWRAALWALPVLRFVMLVLPVTSISVANFLPFSGTDSLADSYVQDFLHLENRYPRADVSDPVANNELETQAEQTATAKAPLAADSASPTTGASGERKTAFWTSFSVGQFAFLIWLAGAAVMVARWIGVRRALRKLLNRSTPLQQKDLLAAIERIRKTLGVRRAVTCVVSDEISGPATCGLSKPIILLPASSLKELPEEAFEMIVVHELSHIRRFDFALISLSQLAVAIHWFNPIAYFVARKIDREIEFATDAMTMKRLGESSLESYVSLLLRLGQSRSYQKLCVAEMANAQSKLKPRVDKLIKRQPNRPWHYAFSLALVCVLALIGLTKAQTEVQTKPTAEVQVVSQLQGKDDVKDEEEFEAWLIEKHGLNNDMDKASKAQILKVFRKRYKDQFRVERQENREQEFNLKQSEKWSLKYPENVKENEFAGVIVDEQGHPIAGAIVDRHPAFTGHETETDQQGMFRVPLKFNSKGKTGVVRFSKEGYSPVYCRKQKFDVPNLCIILDKKTYVEGQVVDANKEPVPMATIVASHPFIWGADYPSFDRETVTKSDENGNYRIYLNPETYTIAAFSDDRGVERLQGIEVKSDTTQTVDIQLGAGVKFRAKVLDSETKEPVPGLTLYHRTRAAIAGVSDADGLIEIPNAFPGDEELQIGNGSPKFKRGYFACPTEPFGSWRSPDAKKPWHRKPTTEVALMFELKPAMDPVTIYVETGVTISGKVTDPDGNPVAQATVAGARTGTGNSLTGDTRYSVKTKEDGSYVIHLPASNDKKYNLIAHDGKYRQWRNFASGVTEPFQTKAGQKLENVDIQLHQPATVRGKVTASDGQSVKGLEVRAHAKDKRGNRYYDPTTTTNDDGSFELSFIRPGKHFVQVEPFWLNAEDAPPKSSMEVELDEGETKSGIAIESVSRK